jgi:uncharacterized protein (TIGR02001 family)
VFWKLPAAGLQQFGSGIVTLGTHGNIRHPVVHTCNAPRPDHAPSRGYAPLFKQDFSGKLPSARDWVGMAQRMLILQQSRLQRSRFAVVRNSTTQLCVTWENLEMKSKQFRNVTLAALGLCAVGATLPAFAAPSASVAVGNMYLWRGLAISNPAPQVSGDINYSHDSGAYAGIWTSSEGSFDGSSETDLTVGFAKKFGEAGIDVGFAEYMYPDAVNATTGSDKLADTDASEFFVGGSFGPVSAKLFINTDESENMYLTIDGMWGKFGAHIGSTLRKVSAEEYNDFNVSYMPVDNLTWTLSFASGDGAKHSALGDQTDPHIVVSYKWPFDVK